MTLKLHVKISTWFSQREMKFQPGMKIPNFSYNRHFFQHGMKIWYYARVNSLSVFKKINKYGNFTRKFQMYRSQTYQSYKMFRRIGQFIGKILILEY